jgi:recombination protein RecA
MAAKETKEISDVLKELEKQYGKGSVISGSQVIDNLEVIDTGSIGLNHALGIGGIPKGKIIEMYGWESSGKSTICQHIVASAQKQGMTCLYVDGENSIDRKYASAIGVDLDKLLIIQLDEHAGEGAYNKMEALVRTGKIDLVIVDSYNSLQPKKVLEGETGDSAIGLHARMQGTAVMKSNSLATQYGTTFIWLGQLREKIGVMYGSPQTTQGGNALKFYSHIRMEVVRSTTKDNSIMNGDERLGNKVTVKVIKNKVAPPFTEAVFDVLYGIGIDRIGELVRLGKEYEVIKVRAGKVTYGEDKYEEVEFRQLLIDNQEFHDKIKTEIADAMSALPVVEFKPVEE